MIDSFNWSLGTGIIYKSTSGGLCNFYLNGLTVENERVMVSTFR